jgi:hypothetical protein
MKSEFTTFFKLMIESGLKIALAWLNARLKTISREMMLAKKYAKEYFFKKPGLASVFQNDYEVKQIKVSRILQFIDLYETHFEESAVCSL